MLNTSDVKSLSKGGTTVSLEEISNSIDNKLSIDNLTGSNGIAIAKNTAGDKVEIGISRSGFELGTFSTDRTGIEFVCSDTTQTINFISPDGDGLLICNMMDSTRSSIILLGSSGEGTMIAYNDMTYTPDSSSSEVKHYLREDNFSTLMSGGFNLGTTEQGFIKLSNSLDSSYNVYMEVSHPSTETIHIGYNDITWSRLTESAKYLRENNVKTIGGQSIYGTGDIPVGGSVSLYRHNIKMTSSDHQVYFTLISSSDTALNTAAKIANEINATVSATGFVTNGGKKILVYCVDALAVLSNVTIYAMDETGNKITVMGSQLSITDKVTTV